MPLRRHAENLETLYQRYNHRRFVSPDPLQFLYAYDEPADREVVGLIAACLAYGRVAQILRSVSAVLDALGPRPAGAIRNGSVDKFERDLAGWKHRFQTHRELAAMLGGAGAVLRRYGSLQAAYKEGLNSADGSARAALTHLVEQIDPHDRCGHLLSDPRKNSACKRLHLFLRWMVRRDAVDVGHWDVCPSLLVVPLDTHMFRICGSLGATSRRQANLAAAMDITSAFAGIRPEDPVRYDFALTRLGIRSDADAGQFLRQCGVEEKSVV